MRSTHVIPDRFNAQWLHVALASLLLVTNATAVHAEERDLIQLGHRIAETECGECHAIGHTDPSPTAANQNTAFRDLHLRFPIPMIVGALSTSVIAGHDEMPAFEFSPEQITALLAYIDSLSPGPRYLR